MNLRVISSPSPSVRTAPILTAEEAVAAARNLAPKFAEQHLFMRSTLRSMDRDTQ